MNVKQLGRRIDNFWTNPAHLNDRGSEREDGGGQSAWPIGPATQRDSLNLGNIAKIRPIAALKSLV
jgi:hypothetical protein